jgi:hypothetical protein
MDLDSMMVEAEDMLPDADADAEVLEHRKYDLAVQLAQQYRSLLSQWQWGDSVLEWVRQCEITFESEDSLRRLLHPDLWPRASRASFVSLLIDKQVPTRGIELDKAVGLRLIFRDPSPNHGLSSEFLFYLNSSVSRTAYEAWSQLAPETAALLPPERFHFDVVNLDS